MAGSKEAGAIYISLQLQTAKLQAGIASAQKSLKSLSSSAQQAGKSLSVAFTLPLAALGTYAVKSFAEFDDAMTRSMAIMGNVGKEMKSQLVQGALDVAKTTKASATEAAEGYYFLASAGLSAAASLKALPVVATFATAANIGLAEASDKLVDVTNAVGLASSDSTKMMEGMARVSDVLAKASIDSNVTINDLASSLAGPLGGALRQNHVQIETAAAALEVLGAQGIKAKVGGTALSIVIRELGIDAVKHADAFKKLGVVVFEDGKKFRNFIDIIKDLETKLKGMSDPERITALMHLGFTKKNAGFIQMFLGLSEQMKKFEEANKTQGEAARLASENMKSFKAQLILLQHKLQEVAITIGNDLAPVITRIGELAVAAAEKFKTLPEGLRKAIEIFGVFLAVGGPLAFFFGNLASATMAFLKIIPMLLSGLSAVVNGLLAMAGAELTAAGLVLWPALLAAAFVAAGVAIYVFWDDIKAGAESAWNAISSAFEPLVTFFAPLFQAVNDLAVVAWDAIKKAAGVCATHIQEQFSTTMSQLNSIWGTLVSASDAAWNACIAGFDRFSNWVKAQAPGLHKVLGTLFDSTIDLAAKSLDIASNEVVHTVNQLGESAVEAKSIISGWMGKLSDKAQEIRIDNSLGSNVSQIQADAKAAEEAWNNAVPSIVATTLALDANNKMQHQSMMSQGQAGDLFRDLHGKTLEALEAEGKAEGEADKATKAGIKTLKEKEKAIDDISKSLDKLKNKDSVGDIQDSLKDAIKSGVAEATFQDLQKKLYDAVYKSYVDGQKDALAKAGNDPASLAKIQEGARITAQEAVDKETAARLDANTQIAQDKADKDKAAYDDSVSYFKGIFSEAIKGGVYDFKSAFQEILVDLAANLAATLGQALGGGTSTSSTGVIGDTSKSGSTNDLTSLFQGAMDAYNSYSGTGGAYADSSPDPGMTGPPMENGEMTASTGPGVASGDYSGYAAAAGTALQSKDTDKASKSNAGTGAAIGAAIGAYWGPIGAQIGAALGGVVGSMFKWGPQHPETLARHAFANFIEENFEKMGQVSFFGKDGHLKNMKGSSVNFTEGEFNAKGSANSVTKLNALGNEARTTFYGLGLALKETLGLTDVVGEHIGAMLAENLGGSVDNARLLFQQLGLSLDDMVEKLVALGRSGSQSWLEIETAIQGVTNAAMPGLAALADYKGAFQELVESGGRGVAALKGVKDIAVEGMEAGAKSLEDLKQRMLNSGLDPEQVNAFFNAVASRGIKTLEELSKVSDRVGGGIVADMNANSQSLAAMWADMGNQLNDIKQKIQDIPTEVSTNYTIRVNTEVDSNGQKILDGTGLGGNLPANTPQGTVKHAKGGIVTGPIGFGGNHVMGENGPEGLFPLHKMGDGSLGVRVAGGKGNSGNGKSTIVINAPYANPGTVEHIRRTVMELEPYLTSRAVDKTIRVANRGGNMGRNFR